VLNISKIIRNKKKSNDVEGTDSKVGKTNFKCNVYINLLFIGGADSNVKCHT